MTITANTLEDAESIAQDWVENLHTDELPGQAIEFAQVTADDFDNDGQRIFYLSGEDDE